MKKRKRYKVGQVESSFRRVSKAKAILRRARALRVATRGMTAERIRLDRHGYQTSGYGKGRYYGTGQKLYQVYDAAGEVVTAIRADSAQTAKEKVVLNSGRLSRNLPL